MKICYHCNRQITNGKRILDNGIRHICVNDPECINIKNKLAQLIKDEEYKLMQISIKNNGGTLVNCNCGLSFYTYFPIETYPNCDDCPKCGATHCRE